GTWFRYVAASWSGPRRSTARPAAAAARIPRRRCCAAAPACGGPPGRGSRPGRCARPAPAPPERPPAWRTRHVIRRARRRFARIRLPGRRVMRRRWAGTPCPPIGGRAWCPARRGLGRGPGPTRRRVLDRAGYGAHGRWMPELAPGPAAALEAFLQHLALERGRSEHTVRAYRGDLVSLLEGLEELEGLDLAWLRRWLAAGHE